jgi:helix-turn-helix protein
VSAIVSGLIWKVGPVDRNLRFVLLAIADNADDNGFAYPGTDLLADKTLFSVRHVLRAIAVLESGGWLKVRRKAAGGRGNHYWIDVPKLRDLYVAGGASGGASRGVSGDISGDMVSRDMVSRDICDTTQVTSATDSGDIRCSAIRKNLQEPSLEPKALRAEKSTDQKNSTASATAKAKANWARRAESLRKQRPEVVGRFVEVAKAIFRAQEGTRAAWGDAFARWRLEVSATLAAGRQMRLEEGVALALNGYSEAQIGLLTCEARAPDQQEADWRAAFVMEHLQRRLGRDGERHTAAD